MTRFARAKGSKASNERLPERSTPWHVMKEDMEKTKKEAEENKGRAKFNKVRQENYDKFLKERDSKVETEWAKFPDEKPKEKILKKGIVKNKNQAGKMINKKQMLKLDKKIDANLSKLTTKIEKVLDKKAKNTKKTDKFSKQNGDAPEEVSSKQTPSNIKITKPKTKATPLKIKAVNVKTSEQSDETEKKGTNEMTKNMKKRSKAELRKEKAKNSGDGESNKFDNIKKNINNQENLKKNFKQANRNKKSENNEKRPKFSKNTKPLQGANVRDNFKKNINNQERQTKRNSNNFSSAGKFVRPLKVAKVRDNLEHKRRKPDPGVEKMVVNGLEIEIMKYDGYPIKKEDFERLTTLKKQMISKGIPRSEVQRTLKLERRRAEKALTKDKKRVCFQCRKAGHMLSECPELDKETISTAGSGICFKCGSTEHTHFECKVTKGEEYKFATCFICREQGHISKQCPDNPRGLYPHGGACNLCGEVTHLKKDCPKLQEKAENDMFLQTISCGNIEGLEQEPNKTPIKEPVKQKVIKF